MSIALLKNRGVLKITGEDSFPFLQGLITADMRHLKPTTPLYTAMLTPQGRFLYDFFILQRDDHLYLDVSTIYLPSLLQRLMMYKLRSKVALQDVSQDFLLYAAWGDYSLPPTVASFFYQDPRHPRLGVRGLVPSSFIETIPGTATIDQYHQHRLPLGIADGEQDLIPEKSFILEYGFDEMGAIGWDKGCYVGQELTTRTKFRGAIHKKIFPVTVEGPLPTPGTAVMMGDTEVGEIRSGQGNYALALLRLEAVETFKEQDRKMQAGDSIIRLAH